jgi:hypothetical protein
MPVLAPIVLGSNAGFNFAVVNDSNNSVAVYALPPNAQ